MHCTQIARHFTDDFSAGRCRIGTRQLLTCKEKQAVHGLFAVATSTLVAEPSALVDLGCLLRLHGFILQTFDALTTYHGIPWQENGE